MPRAKHESPLPDKTVRRGTMPLAIFRAKLRAMRYADDRRPAGDAAHGRATSPDSTMRTPILRIRLLVLAWIGIAALGTGAAAQTNAAAPTPSTAPAGPPAHDLAPSAPRSEVLQPGYGVLHLSATLNSDLPLVRAGVQWRVFAEGGEPDGTHKMVAQSDEAQPAFSLPDGRYIVHAAYGFASAMKRFEIADSVSSDRMNLNAGAIEVSGTLGDAPIGPDKLSLSIFVPDHSNPEAKLVVADAKPGQIIRLPEGSYHVVSTYLDTVGVGSLTPVSNTNSIATADLKVQAGKLVHATLRHRAATLTLKLVNAPGGEALANTSFTILTPGGDVIRELIGAFPSLVLAEGDYVAIARHDGKTYQNEFKVQSALDRDVEVIAK